jgi:hypothetical protein
LKRKNLMRSTRLLLPLLLTSILPSVGRAEAPPPAEDRACCGVSEADTAGALRPEVVDVVSPMYRITRSGRHLVGVTVDYRSGIELSPKKLQAALDCQIARGQAQPSETSPLAVKNVRAAVRPGGERMRVELTADDTSAADEILQRSRRLFVGSFK